MNFKQIMIDLPWLAAIGWMTHLFIKSVLFWATEKGYGKILEIMSERHPPEDLFWVRMEMLGGFKNTVRLASIVIGTGLVIVASFWIHFNH